MDELPTPSEIHLAEKSQLSTADLVRLVLRLTRALGSADKDGRYNNMTMQALDYLKRTDALTHAGVSVLRSDAEKEIIHVDVVKKWTGGPTDVQLVAPGDEGEATPVEPGRLLHETVAALRGLDAVLNFSDPIRENEAIIPPDPSALNQAMAEAQRVLVKARERERKNDARG